MCQTDNPFLLNRIQICKAIKLFPGLICIDLQPQSEKNQVMEKKNYQGTGVHERDS